MAHSGVKREEKRGEKLGEKREEKLQSWQVKHECQAKSRGQISAELAMQ